MPGQRARPPIASARQLVARQQAKLSRRRAESSRAFAEAEPAEAALIADPVHAAPGEHRVKLLEDEEKIFESAAEVCDGEVDRLLSQARTAELRARIGG